MCFVLCVCVPGAGVVLFWLFAANSNWNYDADPFEAWTFQGLLEDLKQRLEKGESVFQDLFRTKLLENSHKVIVGSRPSKELSKKIEKEEKREDF